MAGFWREVENGVELFVRLTPRAGADRLGQPEETADGRVHLKAQVRAVPEKGAANAALEKLVAKSLGLPKSAVSVVAGDTARQKTLLIRADPASVTAALDEIAAEA